MINDEIVSYITSERARGISDEAIRASLLSKGWKEEDVTQALHGKVPEPELMGLFELLGNAVSTYKDRFTLLFLIALLPAVFTVLLYFVAGDVQSAPQSAPLPAVAYLIMLFMLVAYMISGASLILALADRTITDPMAALKRGVSVSGGYFLTSILSGIITILGLLLLIIPGIIFMVWYGFAAIINILEKKSPTEALTQSKSYVTGRWGSIALRLIGGTIILGVLGSIADSLIRGIAGGASSLLAVVLSSVINAVFLGISLTFMYLLYTQAKKQG